MSKIEYDMYIYMCRKNYISCIFMKTYAICFNILGINMKSDAETETKFILNNYVMLQLP